ncbi:MAG: NADH-quinone oxidoreductase subunit N [Bacteroidia bacterium]|nr:NADH-quinone oxidoreductase subunit N [Bacteroidia bacterium]
MNATQMYNLASALRMEGGLLLLLVVLLIYKVAKGENTSPVIWRVMNKGVLLIAIGGFAVPVTAVLFGGMYVSDPLIACQKGILALGTFFVMLQANHWLRRHSNAVEFYMILIAVLMGMFFMVSSGHFLVFYLGLELATIPLAALAAFDFEKQRSSEAGVKMILSSAFSSAILLFGVSLVYGFTGSLYFSDVSLSFSAEVLPLAAFAFLIAGFLFKISAVPFHLWTADVYEGAPVAVTSFLSVISKGAAMFIFVTVLYKVFGGISEAWVPVLSVVAVATMTLGNAMAIRQDNLKRFLAFSSITQVGYLLIGAASAGVAGSSSVVYFILIYIFSNLGAFTVLSVISSRTGKESVSSFSALYKTNPVLSLLLMISVFSLAGIPPTAGFFGKLFLLNAGAQSGMTWVVVIACLNMVVSLYYYLRLVKAMFADPNPDPIGKVEMNWREKFVLGCCLAGILLMAVFPFVFEEISKLAFGIQ